MRVAIVSSHDPLNVNEWSGIPYFVMTEIRKVHSDVIIVKSMRGELYLKFSKVIKYLLKKFGITKLDLSRTNAYSVIVGKSIQKKIKKIKPDVIIGIAASPELANLSTDIPVIHISDATFAAMTDYYENFTNIPSWLWKQGDKIERNAITKSSACVLPSEWAIASAISDYGAESTKMHLLKLGANVENLPNVTDEYLSKKFDGSCKLLFVGKEWKRKGGDIVLTAFEILRKSGMDISLSIVGSSPFDKKVPEGVEVYENLSKNDPEQFNTFNRLFSEASLFVLPTQAEAYGLVFAEAAAYGVPSVTSDTGGIPSVVEQGKSGILLPLSANGEDYAEKISQLWSDKENLLAMGDFALKKYRDELNWDVWRKGLENVLEQTVDH